MLQKIINHYFLLFIILKIQKLKKLSLLSNRTCKPTMILKNSSNILKQAGASLCTARFAEEPDAESNAIWNAFGSLELDLEWFYEIIPAEVIEPEPIPNWYINFLSSEKEIDERLDRLMAGEVEAREHEPEQPAPEKEPPQASPKPTSDSSNLPDTVINSPEEQPLEFESTPPTIFSDSEPQDSPQVLARSVLTKPQCRTYL